MAVNDTDVTICSHALQLLGENTIASFADGTVQANVCSELYPDIRDMVLTMYPWSFSISKVDLQRSSTSPTNEWTYAYPMPSDSMTNVPRAVFSSSAVGASPVAGGWEVYRGEIFTDFTAVTIDYQKRPMEAEMPSYFVQLLKYALAMHLAEPVTDQIQKADFYQKLAFGYPAEGGRGGYFRQAAATDGMGAGTSFIGEFPLVDSRMTLV